MPSRRECPPKPEFWGTFASARAGTVTRAEKLLGALEHLDQPPPLGGRQRPGLHQRDAVADAGVAVLVMRLHLLGGADDLAVERVHLAIFQLDDDGLLH